MKLGKSQQYIPEITANIVNMNNLGLIEPSVRHG